MKREKALNIINDKGTTGWTRVLSKGVLLPEDVPAVCKRINSMDHSIHLPDWIMPLIDDFAERHIHLNASEQLHILNLNAMDMDTLNRINEKMVIHVLEVLKELESNVDQFRHHRNNIINYLSKLVTVEEQVSIASKLTLDETKLAFMKPYNTIKAGDIRHQFIMTIDKDSIAKVNSLNYILPVEDLIKYDVPFQSLFRSLFFANIQPKDVPEDVRNVFANIPHQSKKNLCDPDRQDSFVLGYLEELFAGDVEYALAMGKEINYYNVNLDEMSPDARLDLFKRIDVPVWFSNKNAGAMMQVYFATQMYNDGGASQVLQRMIDTRRGL